MPKNIPSDFTIMCNSILIPTHKYALCTGSPTLSGLIYPSAMKGIDNLELNYSLDNVLVAIKCIYAKHIHHVAVNKLGDDCLFPTYEAALEFIQLAKYLQINLYFMGHQLTFRGCLPEAIEATGEKIPSLIPWINQLEYDTVISLMRISFEDFLKCVQVNSNPDECIILYCTRWFLNIEGDDHKKLRFELVYGDKKHKICEWFKSQPDPHKIKKYRLKCECCTQPENPKEPGCCVIHPLGKSSWLINNYRVQLKEEWWAQIYTQIRKVRKWMKNH
jgi:hypothetical protein